MSKIGSATVVLCVFALCGLVEAGLTQDAIVATRVDQGLFVHLGATDGVIEISAAKTDAFLVHALAENNGSLAASRTAIMAANLYGLASVERAEQWNQLPYGENMVNLLVADLDALGPKGLTESEINRVLVPKGAAYVKKTGAWNVRTKSWTPGMGSWTHFFANPQGTNVGDDLLIQPPTTVKWIVNNQFPRRMSSESATGIRAANGRVLYEFSQLLGGSKRVLVGRDGFNGLLLWKKPGNFDSFGNIPTQYVMNNEVNIYFPDTGFAAAISCKTGELVRRYDQGLTLSQKLVKTHCGMRNSRPQEQIISGEKLIQVGFDRLVVLNVNTGARLAQFTEPHGLNLARPVVSDEENSIFCVAAEMVMNGARWPLADVDAVLCIDLTTGVEKWRNTDLGGEIEYVWYKKGAVIPDTTITRHRIGQLAYHRGTLAVLGPEPLNDCAEPRLSNWGALDSRTGRLLWNRVSPTPHPYTMVVRNDTLYSCNGDLTPFDLRTGAIFDSTLSDRTKSFVPKPKFTIGYNGRCTRTSATPNYFMTGLVTFVDRSYGWCYVGVSRSGCARNVVPAHGMVYYTSNPCGCTGKALSGYEALRYENPWPVLDDGRRLTGPAALPEKASLTQTFSSKSIVAVDWDTTMQNANYYSDAYWKWKSGTGPKANESQPYPLSKTVGGKTYTAVLNEHRLECRENEQLIWSFVTGGRINGLPVVFGDSLAVFGSHDGYVYAVNTATGSPVWRFMAAPSPKKMIAYGQVESSWPVFGVTLSGTTACFSAGRHPQVDGGIYAYGVSAATGGLLWKKRVVTPVYAYPTGTRTDYIANSYLNADSVSQVGIDPAAPQDLVLRSVSASGGTPINDVAVSVDRPYAEKQLLHGKRSPIGIHVHGYKGQSLVVAINAPLAYRLSILSIDGRVVHTMMSQSSAVYEFTSRMLPAGRYVIHVRDRSGSAEALPVTVLF